MERNEKCYCGSEKKYKNCCMVEDIKKTTELSRPVEANRPIIALEVKNLDWYIESINKGLPKYQQEANKRWAEAIKAILSPNGTIICNI